MTGGRAQARTIRRMRRPTFHLGGTAVAVVVAIIGLLGTNSPTGAQPVVIAPSATVIPGTATSPPTALAASTVSAVASTSTPSTPATPAAVASPAPSMTAAVPSFAPTVSHVPSFAPTASPERTVSPGTTPPRVPSATGTLNSTMGTPSATAVAGVTASPLGTSAASRVVGRSQVRPREAVDDTFLVIAGGTLHTCGTTAVGIAFCWGQNATGQLGVGGTTPSAVPMMLPRYEWSLIATGTGHSCAVSTGGEIECWGENAGGQLGSAANPSLVNVAGATWAKVAAGATHSCALTTEGAAYCWGRSDNGQVGDGASTWNAIRATPVAVSGGPTWTQVVARGYATCAVASDDQAYCWGQRMSPRSATNADFLSAPTLVGGSLRWKQVDVGGDHACGVTTVGELYCWGQNASGQLGDGTVTERSGPVAVAGATTSWSSVATGHSHTCAIAADGRAWCWGSNLAGQLGDGGPADAIRKVPGLVASDLTWQLLGAGQSHACGVSDAGVAWCWGANESGQVGDGTTVIIRSMPRRVADQSTAEPPGGSTPVATTTPVARHVRVANVRDTGFTVAWVTDVPLTGAVRWWPEGNSAMHVAYDVRGTGTSDTVHYVTVPGLVAGTRYLFDIVSGGSFDTNLGAHFAVTTGPTVSPVPAVDTATGVVEATDGSRATSAIVIVGVGPTESTSPSAPMAALVSASSNGTWNANLSSLRTADRSGAFAYTDATVATIEVLGGPTAFAQSTVTVANLRLASRPALRLVSTPTSATMGVATGWNLFSLTVDPADPLVASIFCARFDTAGGAGTAIEIVRWEASAWESHRCGIAANDFRIDPDRGYFVRATKVASITITGMPADPRQGRLLEGGWNLVGLGTTSALMDAPTLLASLDGASGTTATAVEAVRWQSGAWEAHQRTLTVNRFLLETGRGYFVRLARPVAWTHVGGSPATGVTR